MNSSFMDFENRWIVLSGASSAIGRQIAMTLAEQNARLILLGRQAETLNALRDDLPGKEHQSLVIDLADTEAINASLKPVLTALGSIYGLCHCAGIVQTKPLGTSAPMNVHQQMDINLVAGIELARLVANRNIGQKGEGSYLFISSTYSHAGAPGQIAYCASKGAVNAAVRAMAVELAPRNIRVNSISPGFVRTEMTEKRSRLTEAQMQDLIDKHPLGEGNPLDIARAVAFLLDPQNRWITGVDLSVDGGYTAQ